MGRAPAVLAPLIPFLLLLLLACSEKETKSTPPGTSPSTAPVIWHSNPIGMGRILNARLSSQYEQETGRAVRAVEGPNDVAARLTEYQTFFGARSTTMDVLEIDVIWPGLLAEHLVDLSSLAKPEKEFLPAIIENNTVQNRLVALPWRADVGLLYYRRDLLEKHGFNAPPATWQELEEMAHRIQMNERAEGKENFWGYLWQGKAREGLTCNALEWQASEGGGTIIEPDGTISVNNEHTVRAFKRAASWVGTISPPEILEMDEEAARELFQNGNAAFMRSWTYAWAAMQQPASPVRGRIAVARIPAGNAGAYACLGGWQLAVSRFSTQPEEALRFIDWLTEPEPLLLRAAEGGYLPARGDLFEEGMFGETGLDPVLLREALEHTVARPSTVAGRQYSVVSSTYFRAVHRILSGEKSAEEALRDLEMELRLAMSR